MILLIDWHNISFMYVLSSYIHTDIYFFWLRLSSNVRKNAHLDKRCPNAIHCFNIIVFKNPFLRFIKCFPHADFWFHTILHIKWPVTVMSETCSKWSSSCPVVTENCTRKYQSKEWRIPGVSCLSNAYNWYLSFWHKSMYWNADGSRRSCAAHMFIFITCWSRPLSGS